jgi:BolA protein
MIRGRLTDALSPRVLEISDESHLHVGHAGARDGRGHFRVKIQSDRFAGLRTIQIHRLIYAAVGDLMDTDIHALTIEASDPQHAG